jgi:hypothetical protein
MRNRFLLICAFSFILCSQALARTSESAQETPATNNPPKVVTDPGQYYKYSADSRRFTGISSMAVTPGGRLWVTWYAGPTPNEDANNYVVLATSDDGGQSWEEVLVVDPDGGGPVRAYDPQVWIDPDNKMWLFWAQSIKHDGLIAGVWAVTTSDIEAKHPQWGQPERLTTGVMMNKPTVLANGEWLFPVSTWKDTDHSAKAFVTADSGKTWSVRGGSNVPKDERIFDEHTVVEKEDGTLWMWVRINNGIGESLSKDGGKTWTDCVKMRVEHPSSRFFVRRLQSGNLLLVKNGPVEYRTGRSHMMAFISKDDGLSWSRGLLLDGRTNVSYPDGQQAQDGTIYITYDRNRTTDMEINMISFTEEDILAPDYDTRIVKVAQNRVVVSRGGKH